MNYNQPFVYPDDADKPQWVIDRLSNFHKQLEEDVRNNQKLDNLRDKIIDNLETNILPKGVRVTEPLSKKGVSKLIEKFDTVLDDVAFMWHYYLLINAGFVLSSVIPSSFQPEALIIPDQFIKDKNVAVQKYNDSPKTTEDALAFQKEITKIAGEVRKYFDEKGIYVVDLMNSGAKGGTEHIQSLLLSVGLSINSFGEINDVISNAHVEGLTQTQFFNGSSQAIQALYAKSSDTAKPGYLGRKLSNIAERIKLSTVKDCRSTNYLSLKVRDARMLDSLIGRYYKSKLGTLTKITEKSNIIGTTINLRSPLYCKAKDGICSVCYNEDYINLMKLQPGANIGLLATTGMTGTLVNLTLKKSHTGVGLDKEEIDFNKEIEKQFG